MRHLRLIIILLAVAFAVALLGTRALFVREDHEAALQRTATGAEDLARIVEEYARRILETADLVATDMLGHMAAMGGLNQGGGAALRDQPATEAFLRDLAARSKNDYLSIIDAAGAIAALSFATAAPANQSFADRDWFKAHQAGADVHIGKALHSRLTGEVLFTYSRAIRRADGSLEGVAQVAMRQRFFQQGGLTAEGGRNALLSLWRPNGEVVALTGLSLDQVELTHDQPGLLARALQNGSAVMRQILPGAGQDRMLALRRVDGWPLVAAASLPVEAALAANAASHAWSRSVVIGTLLVVGLLTWFALRLNARAELAARAVSDARAALENKVVARTRELAEVNSRLAAKEQRYRAIFNSSFQFISVLTPDGKVVEINDTALDFAGITADAVVGLPFWETPYWVDRPIQDQLRDAVARAATGEFIRFEHIRPGTGDPGITADVSLKPVRDAAGAVVLLVAEGRDISDLKSTEAQLRQAQKLETLGQLTGGMAHDFNNLLMVVLGNLALLKKRLGTEDARVVRLLDGATQGAERGAALTKRLLAFARRQALRPEAINIARLVAGMDELLSRTVAPVCHIRSSIPDNLPQALADVNQVELALLNLAVNARDAMPLGGEISISARQAASGESGAPAGLTAGQYLCVAVIDQGTGMDQATLRRATEPFFTTKGPGKGSGLGLSMVHGLAAQSGGQLRIVSTPGQGTTVELWLPVDALVVQAVVQPPAAAPPRHTGRPLSVLLVDDDALVLAGSAAMLEDLGHQVVAVGSGEQALGMLTSGQGFDLMITDFAMPLMDGLELVRRASALKPLLSVILASGFAELAAGVEATLPRLDKPYRQEALAAMIGRVVEPASDGRAPPLDGDLGPRPSGNVVRLPVQLRH